MRFVCAPFKVFYFFFFSFFFFFFSRRDCHRPFFRISSRKVTLSHEISPVSCSLRTVVLGLAESVSLLHFLLAQQWKPVKKSLLLRLELEKWSCIQQYSMLKIFLFLLAVVTAQSACIPSISWSAQSHFRSPDPPSLTFDLLTCPVSLSIWPAQSHLRSPDPPSLAFYLLTAQSRFRFRDLPWPISFTNGQQ